MEDQESKPIGRDHQQIASMIRETIATRGLSQAEVARQADMSGAVLSEYLSGQYRGNREEVARKLTAWHDGLADGDSLFAVSERIEAFARTPIAMRIQTVLKLAKFGNMVMIVGASGVGKSEAFRNFQQANTAVWYSQFSKDTRSNYAVLTEIAEAVHISDLARSPDKARRQIVGRVERTRGLLLCDEAQHLTPAGLEIVRTIHDRAGIGIALAGHLDLADNVAKLPQVNGRISAPLRIASASPEDADALFDSWGLECKQSRTFLRGYANRATGLRGIAKAFKLATIYAMADSAAVSFDHITRAWSDMNRPAQAA